ncbi:MAG: T9SS type A sorting domain-containing protein [Bacteroidales bacterium]|nr:T9SS type A sorting domain-containing protein [Bacteroidales bacterium]
MNLEYQKMKLIVLFSVMISLPFLCIGQDSLQVDFFTVPVSSGGLADGQIDLRIKAGIPPYTIYWSTGVHQENQTGLAAGVYQCTITDGQQVPHLLATEVHQPGAFTWTYTNTGDNHTILIPEGSIQHIQVEDGDYIGVFYKLNNSYQCGGYLEIAGTGNQAVTAWGDNSLSAEKDGFSYGEPFVFAWYDLSSQRMYYLQSDFSLEGFANKGYYASNGISGLSQLGNISNELAIETVFQQIPALYPNPCLGIVNIRLDVPPSQPVELNLYDNFGRLVFCEIVDNQTHTLNVSMLPAGVYLLQIATEKAQQLIIMPD